MSAWKMTLVPFKIFLVLIVLGILGFSLNYALDPQETSNQEKDEMTKNDAGSLIDAINGYFGKNEKYIWEGTNLHWTRARELDLKTLVGAQFLLNVPKSADEIYIGRGKSEKDKVWACYTPSSKHERVDTIKLRSVAAGEELPKDGIPKYCEEKPDWQNSFCFTCISQ